MKGIWVQKRARPKNSCISHPKAKYVTVWTQVTKKIIQFCYNSFTAIMAHLQSLSIKVLFRSMLTKVNSFMTGKEIHHKLYSYIPCWHGESSGEKDVCRADNSATKCKEVLQLLWIFYESSSCLCKSIPNYNLTLNNKYPFLESILIIKYEIFFINYTCWPHQKKKKVF